jgi:hypothetical protein
MIAAGLTSGITMPVPKFVFSEPKKPGLAFGGVMRCWNCGAQVGEKVGAFFEVKSNKVEVGGIPLVEGVWRRCRGGRANPACRAINTIPVEWLVFKDVVTH